MSDKYPAKELLKLLPQQWPEGFVGLVVEESEDGVSVKLGKENDLLPSGRVRPLIELFIEDKERNSDALDDIDRQMEPDPFEAQMSAVGMEKKREVVELDGKKFFSISQSEGPLTRKQDMRILYVRDRFLVRLQGKSDVLSVPLAQKIVQSLNFSAELSLPEEKPKKRSPTDALENVMTAAYAPIMEEAESIQDELDELEKLHYEGKIPADEYQRKKMELLAKAMALSQKIGAGYVQQVQTFASQVCPNCGAAAVNVKFCPQCGTKIPEETKCSSCGTVLRPDHKFCPECGAPRKGKRR